MPKHRLVAIGDSLTQGFQNGAIHHPELSFPAWVARAMGAPFVTPEFSGAGGIPLNLEWLLRRLGQQFGDRIGLLELPAALINVHTSLDRAEDYWERGPGSLPIEGTEFHHNLGVWGYEIGDALRITSDLCDERIPAARDNRMRQIPEAALYRTARRVLNPAGRPERGNLTALGVAQRLAREDGIENLIVMLGANHALGTMTRLELRLSEDVDVDARLASRRANLYRPEHFRTLYARLLEQVDAIGAERVFLGTVPHVTIPPVARGVGTLRDGYYDYYTRPWVWDKDFAPDRHDALSGDEAREIDAHIDQYNAVIRLAVDQRPGRHLIDVGRLLDRLAFRRRRGQVRFPFPAGLVNALRQDPILHYLVDTDGTVRLDTRFPRTRTIDGAIRLLQGGLFSLDGMHPTTIGYGLVAWGVLQSLQDAGVETQHPDVDWSAIVAADTLLRNPPLLLNDLHALLTFLDRRGLLSAILELF